MTPEQRREARLLQAAIEAADATRMVLESIRLVPGGWRTSKMGVAVQCLRLAADAIEDAAGLKGEPAPTPVPAPTEDAAQAALPLDVPPAFPPHLLATPNGGTT